MSGRFLRRRAAVAKGESQRLVEESKARLAELLATADALTKTLREIGPDDRLRAEYEGRVHALTVTITAGQQELAGLEQLVDPAERLDYDPFPARSISPDPEVRRYDPPA